jgi:type I restriction enzyme S subunit
MMKLEKSEWKIVRFERLAFNISERVEPSDTTLDKYIGLEHLDTGKATIERCGKPEKVIGTKLKIYKGDIIFGKRRAYQRKAAVADFDAICSAHSMVLRANEETVIKDFLINFMHSDMFMNRAISISEGSLSPTIKWKTLAKQEFPLPPIDQQKRLVELFQSIEQSIVRMQEQEGNLKALRKTLSNGLANKKPVFGNLLSEKNCTPYSFGEIIDCIEQHDKTPLENGLTRFIGLENIESENFTLQGFGNLEDGTTFTKRFSKGDVLFGKRRAYLKKVAVADFDGICSSDILVFRAKAKTMLPELLPYYASSDTFMNHAVSTSAGSLSPRTKWRDLARFQLSIPDVKTQEKIVDVLNQLSKSLQLVGEQKETLKKLKQKLPNEILS